MNRRSFVLLGVSLMVPGVSGCTLAAPVVTASGKADGVLVKKKQRTLLLMQEGKLLKTYPIQLGSEPEGPKMRQGDGKTPEGTYRISQRNPQSQYHLSLRVSYPSPEDRRRAAQAGVSPGGDIFIHGMPNWAKAPIEGDWTAGCIAVKNSDMEEIWDSVPVGCPISILA